MREFGLRSLTALLCAAATTASLACTSLGAQHRAVAEARTTAHEVHAATGAPAFAIAVVSSGRIVLDEAYGLNDRATGVAATASTAFRIGSVTKLFTSLALVRLVGEGTIQIDEPVARYVPEFPQPAVTIDQLAHHLGGIRHYGRSDYINTRHYANAADALERFAHDPLVAAPGEKYAYSSYGYNLLGLALERAARTPFTELIQRSILQPFAMHSTGVDAPKGTTVARFYGKDQTGAIVDAPFIDLSDRVPSGGYVSTAGDLARFLIGVMRLPAPSQEMLFRSGRTTAGAETHVGLGWRIGTDSSGRTYLHHGGESIGGRAFVLLYPKERVGVVMLANLSFAPFGEKEALAVAAPFLKTP